MFSQGESQRLANELFETRSKLRAAGRALHDEVGPLLSAAGIRLDLLRSDHPETAPSVELALSALEEGMERVRALSRELNPPPSAHLGLKRALSNLVESQRGGFAGMIRFSYTASVEPPHDDASGRRSAPAARASAARARTPLRCRG